MNFFFIQSEHEAALCLAPKGRTRRANDLLMKVVFGCARAVIGQLDVQRGVVASPIFFNSVFNLLFIVGLSLWATAAACVQREITVGLGGEITVGKSAVILGHTPLCPMGVGRCPCRNSMSGTNVERKSIISCTMSQA